MKKAAFIDIKGIKCDNKSCDYSDMEAEFIPDKYLNAPCPKCGSNLFTQADYDLMQNQIKAIEALNSLFANIEIPDDALYLTTEVLMDGSGKAKIGKTRMKDGK